MKTELLIAGAVAASLLGALSTQAQFTTPNVLVNPGAEDGLNGWTSGGNSNPHVDSGTFNTGINPHSGSFAFVGGSGSFGSLSQTIDLSSLFGITSVAIDTDNLNANVSFWAQGLNQGTPSDSSRITLTFHDGSLATIGSVSTPEVDSHNLTWENATQIFAVPTGTRSIDYTMEFIRHVGADNDSYVDDNNFTLSVVPEPSAVSLVTVGALALGAIRVRRSSGSCA